MMRRRVLIFLALLACPLSAMAVTMQVPPAPPGAPAPATTVDGNVRRDVVAKLGDALRNDYIFPDVGEKAAEKISAALAAGQYDSLADPNAFAARLSADVAAVAHDKHLSVRSMSAPPPPPPTAPQAMPRADAGITRADKLAGGVGYIEVIGFPPLPAFKPAADKAMLALKGSRALIIDARRNGGGSPDGVAYLVSFLVAPNHSIEISDIVSRVPKTKDFDRKRFDSQPTPVSFAKIPVYVLTSKDTFSGGEEFAYDVQTHKLGKVVGEVTGGGAHPTGPADLGHGFVATIPFGRTENPVTKTNWEGRGVQPDISVPAQDAFKTALTRLGGKPAVDIASASPKQVFAPRSAPLPGTEAVARQFIAGLASGNPDYAAMTPEFAKFNREQLEMTRRMFSPLGELRSTRFEGAGMMGGDEYRASFAKGAMIVDVMLSPDGKIAGAMMRPAPAGE
jgi:Peptidase family S41/N-terminal domain of Peptidase_S41 in eukaryotic IRBP